MGIDTDTSIIVPRTSAQGQPKPPIIFVMPGFEPDAHLQVFDQPFHVASIMLKIHSAFFQKFLDSADKTDCRESSNGPFKYNWVTKVDEDGTWSLMSSQATLDTNLATFTSGTCTEEASFAGFLGVIYGREVLVKDKEALKTLVKFADYYCALPVLSNSLYRIFAGRGGYWIIRQFINSPCDGLVLAAQLRNAELFRDCVMYAINPWTDPHYHTYRKHLAAHPKIEEVVNQTWSRNCLEVCSYQDQILIALSSASSQEEKEYHEVARSCRKSCLIDSILEPGADISWPRYVRKLYDTLDKDRFAEIREILGHMLVEDVTFQISETQVGEEGMFEDHFLFFNPDLIGLPWDRDEKDW